MGGNAFANRDPPLPTPRLSPAEYRQVRNALVSTLREHFWRVAVPIEGPGKTSFGDVDINLSQPKSQSSRAMMERPVTHHSDNIPLSLSETTDKLFAPQIPLLETVLKPAARINSSFALPKGPLLGGEHAKDLEPEPEPAYVQVDITILPPDQLPWHYFMHSHGDTWNMLSPSLRRAGLVVTDIGLCLIHPLIAPMDRKRSRLALTSDPDSALHFLGLDAAVFWGKEAHLRAKAADGCSVPELFCAPDDDEPLAGRSFASEEEHFAFLATCRFFDPSAYKRTHVKSQERRRVETRPAYGRFVRDFVPRAVVRNDDVPRLSYAETITEALGWFGKWAEYDVLGRTWKEEQEVLDQKRLARTTRRLMAEEEMGYADAWLGYLGRK